MVWVCFIHCFWIYIHFLFRPYQHPLRPSNQSAAYSPAAYAQPTDLEIRLWTTHVLQSKLLTANHPHTTSCHMYPLCSSPHFNIITSSFLSSSPQKILYIHRFSSSRSPSCTQGRSTNIEISSRAPHQLDTKSSGASGILSLAFDQIDSIPQNRFNDFAHRAPGKIPQTSPNPHKGRSPS